MEQGACKFCGQIHMVEPSEYSPDEAATRQCDCAAAVNYLKRTDRRQAVERYICRKYDGNEKLISVCLAAVDAIFEYEFDKIDIGKANTKISIYKSKDMLCIVEKITTKKSEEF